MPPTMSARALPLATLTAALACTGGGGDTKAPPPPATALTDAGAPPIDAGITTLPTYDPRAGYFLDPDPGAPRAAGRAARRDRPSVSLLLRSTPANAIAAVDGVRLGPTPVLWDGEGGVPHEFTFVLAGHALARYRFVPVVSGVVHGNLIRIASDSAVPAPEIPAPISAGRPPPATPAAPPPPPPAPPVDAAIVDDAAAPIDAGAAPPPVTPAP